MQNDVKEIPGAACAEVRGALRAGDARATAEPARQRPVLRAIESVDDVKRINAARSAAGLAPATAPTHIVELNGAVVGYASLNAIPIFTGWVADSVSMEEGRSLIAEVEQQAAMDGLRAVMFPCTADCRFIEDMEAMGYHRGRTVKLFVKGLV